MGNMSTLPAVRKAGWAHLFTSGRRLVVFLSIFDNNSTRPG